LWAGSLIHLLIRVSAEVPGADPFAGLSPERQDRMSDRLRELAGSGRLDWLGRAAAWVAENTVQQILQATRMVAVPEINDPDLLTSLAAPATLVGQIQTFVVSLADVESLDEAQLLLDDLIEQWQHVIDIPQAS